MHLRELQGTQYPLSNRFINKIWFIHTMEYYGMRNKTLTHHTAYKNLEVIKLNKLETKDCYVVPFI